MKFIRLLVFSFIIMFAACEDEPIENPQGKVTKYSECKNFTSFYKSMNSNSESCIIYSYNGINKLLLTHVNAGFNCCPNSIYATVNLDGNKLIINEGENANDCRCLCLYDIEIAINNISPGNYTIVVNEPYAENGPPFEFEVNLNSAITDSMCVGRNYYPWGSN